MTTLTADQTAAITDYLDGHKLVHGLGTKKAACSMAAINLALNGKLTDDTPECMSEVIGAWLVPTQDKLPLAVLNGPEWRSLLPLAAGTGRDHEPERLALVMDAMWERLALVQPTADAGGYGEAWATMLRERTRFAAYAAYAAYAADAAAADAAADAAAGGYGEAWATMLRERTRFAAAAADATAYAAATAFAAAATAFAAAANAAAAFAAAATAFAAAATAFAAAAADATAYAADATAYAADATDAASYAAYAAYAAAAAAGDSSYAASAVVLLRKLATL